MKLGSSKWISPTMPTISIRSDWRGIMANDGDLVEVHQSKNQFLWRFGFCKGSPEAKAMRTSVPHFIWVIATRNGTIIKKKSGWAIHVLPKWGFVKDWAPY